MVSRGINRSVRLLVSARTWLLIVACGLLIGLTAFASGAEASNSLVVTITADGTSRTIKTTEGTVASILDKVGVEIGEKDLVEPTLDTQIKGPIYHINVYRARPVLIEDQGREIIVRTPYSSPQLIAADAGLTLYREDIAQLSLVNDIVASGIVGEKLVVDRATAMQIDLYGNQFTYRTHASSVADVLSELTIKPEASDQLSQPLSQPIIENLPLSIVRIGTTVTTTEEIIAYASDVTWDEALPAGTRLVRSPGLNGRRVVTYEILYHNNQEVSRQELESIVIEQPVSEKVTIGTAVSERSDSVALGEIIAASRGYSGQQWQCLYELWVKESQWTYTSENPTSGAYGIPQALPGSKMAAVADDWRTNPATQITWGLNYIEGRYGTPCDAWNFWQQHHWY